MSELLHEKQKLSSFDKNYSTKVYLKTPDKYKQLEKDSLKADSLISRGAGYSYAAASFKEETLSICMKNFNKVLYFDKEKKLITVESGITVIEFLNFTLKHKLWIPQVPGYPFISLGGAIASNVHGKSAGLNGTIRNAVKEILIFHKTHGWLTLSQDQNKDIFDLTIGGYGLTGTIVKITLKLIDFEGFNFQTSINKINSINEALSLVRNSKDEVYAWHRVRPNMKNFGDGLVFCNKIDQKNSQKNLNDLKPIKSKSFKNLINFCFWNKFTVQTFHFFFFNYYKYLKKNIYKNSFNNVIFPFLGKELYFSLFGNKGFFESQILISHEKVESYINDFKKIFDLHNPAITLFVTKEMSGEHRYLRFEGNMTCITINIANNQKSLNFMNELDKLYIRYEVLPSIIKDSRMKREVFDKCYKFANEFRKDLRNFDSKRFYRSELSDRLDL